MLNSPSDQSPPTISISSPASGSPVSEIITVQLSANDDTMREVKLHTRAKDSSEKGTLIGFATSEPYVISWYTVAPPSLAELELVGTAIDM